MKIKTLEKKFQKKIKRNTTCLGVDTASRTGWAIIKTTDKDLFLSYAFINAKQIKDTYFKYNILIDAFKGIITNDIDEVIIEDTFFGRNVKTLKLLSRIGMIVYIMANEKKIKKYYFINATKARANLGLTGNAKKEIVQKQFKKMTNIKINDDDIIDAIILSMNGIIENESTRQEKLQL